MTTEAEVWRTRYQTLRSAVVGVCSAAELGAKKMGGEECIGLITAAVRAIEDGGKIDAAEGETGSFDPYGRGGDGGNIKPETAQNG